MAKHPSLRVAQAARDAFNAAVREKMPLVDCYDHATQAAEHEIRAMERERARSEMRMVGFDAVQRGTL